MKQVLALFCCISMLVSCKAQQEDNKSLLWRVSGKGLAKPSYLFGTMHMICPDDYLWTDAMKKSLGECDQICFELDMDDPTMMLTASAGMMSQDGKKLQDYFTPEQWSRLSRFMLDSMDADISQMQMMKPIVLGTVLATKSIGCAFPVSYEANIMEQAQNAKQEVIGIEEVQEQIDVFKTLPDDTLVASLMEATDSFARVKVEYAQMVTAYKRQDLPALFNLVKTSTDLGADMGPFLDERNKKWIPRMAKMMQWKSTFFAVGAGHLWGDTGVITLLRKEGYTVVPVR